MSVNVWFSYEGDEAELQDVTMDTNTSTLRRRLHDGKLFRFPEGTTQTDLNIGTLQGNVYDKWKPRTTLDEMNFNASKDTLYVRIEKRGEDASPAQQALSNVPTPVSSPIIMPAAVQQLSAGPSPTPVSAPPATGSVSNAAVCPSFSSALLQGAERALRWEYNPYTSTAEWSQTALLVRTEQVPFAEGNFRKAYYCYDLSLNPSEGKLVAKIAKGKCPRAAYFEDVRTQMIARKWADRYNERNPPKKVAFLMSWVLEMADRPGEVICGVEPHVEGKYIKYNNNSGYVGTDDRNTPQAFSHFTYEHSNHQLLIIDIQGVADWYTDPQIHTYDGVGFGMGNLGQKGFERFLESHRCNAVCQYLGLQSVNAKTPAKDMGTQIRPDLDFGESSSAPVPILGRPGGGSFGPSIGLSRPGGGSSVDLADRDRMEPYRESYREKQDSRSREAPVKEAEPDLSSLWDLKSIKFQETIKAHADIVNVLCVYEDTLFSGSADTTIKVWDIKTLQVTDTLKGHEGGIEALCANDQYLFTGSTDGGIKAWDVKRHRYIHTLEGHEESVFCFCINDQYLFSGSGDKSIKVWNLKTFDLLHTLEGHGRAIKALCVSGQYLFSGSNDMTIKVWDLKSFRCSYTLKGHTKWVKSLCILGTSLYSGSYDKTIRVWSLKSLECTSTLRGHERWVEAMTITPKGLFSASDDNTIRVWDLESQKCIGTLEGHSGSVGSVVVHPGKRLLFSGSHDTTIRVWSWPIIQ
eukprot:TRINITY_DN3359_c0_g1_i3.p1 TRINITY_DN3359_c0_g1~~TRINITY_DN3359_c0_g1_i3.p1  ORF type:complete len:785 (-),score=166.46 TRINITY_DN3359_c0_g1_i3:106-2343(-)